jgi:hypothetical protein
MPTERQGLSRQKLITQHHNNQQRKKAVLPFFIHENEFVVYKTLCC